MLSQFGSRELSNLWPLVMIKHLQKQPFGRILTFCVPNVITEKGNVYYFLRRNRVCLGGLPCWQTAADIAVGFADSIGLSWPSLIECGPLSKSKSTHRPRQRKAPSRTLMINQKELERTFDCVYSQINKLTASQRPTELLSSVSEDHKNMISDHDNRNIWRKHTHEIWHLKRGEGLVISSSLLPQISL